MAINGMDYWWKRAKEYEEVLKTISKQEQEAGLHKVPTYEAQLALEVLEKYKAAR